MSDESQPPALRLKPRLRVGNEPAPAASAAAPIASAAGATGGVAGAESGNQAALANAPLPAVPAILPMVPPPLPASGEESGGIASTEQRVRLKPRLTVNPQTAQPVAPASEAPVPAVLAASSSETPAEPLPLSLPPIGMMPPVEKSPVGLPIPPLPMAAPAADAATRFKLRPKAPVPVPAGIVAPAAPVIGATEPAPMAAATLPPPPAMVPVLVAPPPLPVVAPPPAKPSGTPHVPHIRAPGEEMPIPKPPPLPVGLPKRPGISKPRLIAIMVAGGGIFVLVAYLALRPSPPPPTAPKAVTKLAPPPTGQGAKATTPQGTKDAVTPKPAAPGPTPSATLNEIAAAPKQAVDKAKEVVAARRGNEQARIDAMAAGEEAPDKRALDTPPPSRLSGHPPSPDIAAASAPVAGSGSVIAPGVTATTSDVMAAPKASAAFTRFVADAHITGVFQGTPARALINGRMIRAGEVVDQALGVVFDSIDAEKKTITFKDRAGSPATRRY